MKILMINGKYESGKTTLANNLYENVDIKSKYNLFTHAFADYPKEAIAEILGKDYQYFNRDKEEVTEYVGQSGLLLRKRQLMQFLFEDVFCCLDKDIWVKKIHKQILLTEKRFKDETKESIHIISDLRKRSEFEFIKENFKNTEIKAVRLLNNKNNHDNHISEIDLDKANIFDIAINTSILNASATLLLMLDAMKTWGW